MFNVWGQLVPAVMVAFLSVIVVLTVSVTVTSSVEVKSTVVVVKTVLVYSVAVGWPWIGQGSPGVVVRFFRSYTINNIPSSNLHFRFSPQFQPTRQIECERSVTSSRFWNLSVRPRASNL